MEIGAWGVYVFLFIYLYFEVFLLICFFEKRPASKTAALPKQYPSVSIIVPCFNEERTIASTITSLLSLRYPKEKLSIIVVNDGSQDGTLSAAQRFKNNKQVAILSKENGGKYTALNLGISNATSDIIGCLDADSFVTEDALLETVKKFEEDRKIMAVVPAMKVHRPHTLLELMQAVEYTFGIFYKKMFSNLGAISVLPGPFSLYRREVFNTVGLFRRAHNTEDMEMAFRMHAHGLLIENAHTSIVYTKVPTTLRSLIKQRTRWSQGFLENSRDYRHMYFNPAFGYFGILVLPFLLAMFFGTLYMVSFMLLRAGDFIYTRTTDLWAAQIPLHMPAFQFDWFYLDTSTITFLVAITLVITLISVLLGRRIAGANFGILSLMSYFMLYGFIAPLWLARALWATARAKESIWR